MVLTKENYIFNESVFLMANSLFSLSPWRGVSGHAYSSNLLCLEAVMFKI